MARPAGEAAAKAAFAGSLLLAAFLYGFAARHFGLFPSGLLTSGWRQFEEVRAAAWGGDAHPATEPRVHRRSGARLRDSAAAAPGLTLVPSVWEDYGWRPGLKLIGLRGRVHHRWRVDPAEVFPRRFSGPMAGLMDFNETDGSHLLPDGDVLVVVSRVGTARLDACSRVEWRVRGNHHHSVARAADGSFWVSGRKEGRAPDPITGADSVRHDLLVHLSADGEVLERIPVFEILEENRALLLRHLRFRPEDTHLNDVEPLPPSMADTYPLFEAGDLLVSLKHLNAVLVVDPSTLEVRWWAGGPFVQQHDPDFVGGGWIGVFDNREDGTARGSRLGGSRVVGLKPGADSTAVWLGPSDPARVYTSNRGSWQRLSNGNLLLTESNAGRVVEASPEGELVWEWVQPPYRENRVPRVYWAERYDVTPEEAASWPCAPGDSAEGGDRSP